MGACISFHKQLKGEIEFQNLNREYHSAVQNIKDIEKELQQRKLQDMQ
jgi:hypothetical protein